MLALSLGMLLIASLPDVVLAALGVDVMSRPVLMWSQALTQLLTFLVPVLLMTLIYYRGRQREYYRLDFSGRAWGNALAGVVVMVLLVPAIDWLTVWNDSWNLGRVGEMLRSLQNMTEGKIMCSKVLDDFLRLSDKELLTHAGTVTLSSTARRPKTSGMQPSSAT